MATAIQFLRSDITSLRPTPLSLSEGMPMVNFNAGDPGLYMRLQDQSLMKIGPTSVGDNPPNYHATGYASLCVGEQWLDTSITVDKPRPVLNTWDGFNWIQVDGGIQNHEQEQDKNTIYAGPEQGLPAVPTFRAMAYDDLPNNIPLNKLADAEPGKLLIGGTSGWASEFLSLNDDSISQIIGENFIDLRVTAGNIAGAGDGQIQLNYDGKFTDDSRLKFLRTGSGVFHSYTSTEFGNNISDHTHTFIGATSISGDLNIAGAYDLTLGGDLIVAHNATIGSDPLELLKVYSKSEFYSDVYVKDFNNLYAEHDVKIDGDTIIGTGFGNSLTVNSESTFLAGVSIGRGCLSDTFVVDANSTIKCDLTVEGTFTNNSPVAFPQDVELGTDCTNVVKTNSTQLNKCDIFVGTNVPTANAWQLQIEAATGDLTTKGSIDVTKTLTVGDPLLNQHCIIDDAGNIEAAGTVSAEYFQGDGSGLYNLASPNAMVFHGNINATVDTPPVGAQPGDFWLNTTAGIISPTWPNIGNLSIDSNQFLYYYQVNPTTFKWSLGSVQDGQGFVTASTDQEISGKKTFKDKAYFDDDLNVRLQKSTILSGALAVDGASQLNDTVTMQSTLSVVGNTDIGTDAIALNADGSGVFSGSITPKTDGGAALGTPTLRWSNVYAQDMHFNNTGKEGGNDIDGTTGHWTLQEGKNDLFLINNLTGMKFKISMEPA